MKKVLILFITFSLVLLSMSGCMFAPNRPYNPIWDYDFSQMKLIQLEPPVQGQTIVTINTTLGSFKAMLFEEYAPNTVKNFLDRIEEGFYENREIFGAVEGEFFSTGFYDKEGLQGVTGDGKLIPNEYSVNLWPFKGSLISFSRTIGFGDSRFIVSGSTPFTEEDAKEFRDVKRSDGSRLLPEELVKAFEENGNMAKELSVAFTIFGQVIEGFDVLELLMSIPTEEDTARTIEEHYIINIEVSKWQ